MSALNLFRAIQNGPQSSIKKATPLADFSNAHIAALDNAKMLSLNKVSARITAAVRGSFAIIQSSLWPVGGTDPKTNPRLEQELVHAKAGAYLTTGTAFPHLIIALTILVNMTKQGIERAVTKGEPRALAEGTFSVTYEAMFPGGIAVIMYAPQHVFNILTYALQ